MNDNETTMATTEVVVEETAKTTTAKSKTKKAADAPTFGKAQLLASAQFSRPEKYFLDAILDGDRQYTIDEARRLLGKEMERTVQ